MAHHDLLLALALADAITQRVPLAALPRKYEYPVAHLFWTDLARVARRHGLGAYLLWTLQNQNYSQVPVAIWEQLKADRNRATLQYWLIEQTVAQIDSGLAQSGIPSLWIKGVALAATVYPSGELRSMVDADVLVPYELRANARQAAEQLGYAMQDVQLFDGSEGIKHHYFLRGNTQNAVNLELHFRLLGMADRFLPLERQEWFWQQTNKWESGNQQYLTLRPEAHVLYLAAHALLQHGEADFQLQRYLDIHLLLSQSSEFDWELLIDQAVVLGWTFCVQRALEITQGHFHTLLPEDVMEKLAVRRPAHENVQHVTRRQVIRPNAKLVIDELAAMGNMACMKAFVRIVFPPSKYMRWRYGTQYRWKLPLLYAKRIGAIVGQLGELTSKRLGTS